MSPPPAEPLLADRLRRFAAFVTVIAIATAAFGFLPGERRYHQTDPCFGQTAIKVLSALSRESYHAPNPSDCKGQDNGDVDEYPAGGNEVWIPLLVIVLAPALGVYRRPTRSHGWSWFVWALVAGLASFVVAVIIVFGRSPLFDHPRIESLWPGQVVSLGIWVLALAFTFGLFLVLIRTPKPAKPAALPSAIVVP